MKRLPPDLICCLLFTFVISPSAGAQINGTIPDDLPPIRIDVHAHGASTPIPPTIFGSFLEPIDNSTYNGLWAELLENPSFEPGLWSAPLVARRIHDQPELARASELDLPLPWAPLYPNQGNRYEPHRGDAANSDQSLLLLALSADSAHAGEVGVRQRVYPPVSRERNYNGSLWVKHLSGPADIAVSLRERDHPERVLASATIAAPTGEWTKYSFTLQVQQGTLQPLEAADFVISVRDDARTLIDQASLTPADAVEGMDPDVVRMAKDLHSPLLRFGGNFTSSYHWRDGIGPRDKRVSMRNLAWGIPEYNTFGTDEVLEFCKLIGAQPQIALNLGSGTPAEAADWVRYVDDHWGDHHGGLYWELGNELWGDWNMGYPTLGELADRTTRFSQAIRAVDPSAKLIATGADEDTFRNWDAQLLTTPPNTFQYISTHFVVTMPQVQLPHPSAEFVALAGFALPVGLGTRMQEIAAQIAQSDHKEAKLAFTEWLFVGRNGSAPDFKNMGGAIDTAGFLNMIMRNAGIVPISDMTGILDFAGISKDRGQVFGAPGYWALQMYATARPERLLATENASPTYSVQQGVGRLPEIPNVPWLEVQAAQTADPNKIVLFCVNRSLTRDLRASVHLDDFVPADQASVQTLTAPSIYVENDADSPDSVMPHTSFTHAGKEFAYTFPHASVVVIELTRKRP